MKFYTLREASERLRLPRKHLAYLIRCGRLECTTQDGKHVIPEHSIDAYLGIEARPYVLPDVFEGCTKRTKNLLRKLEHFHSLEEVAELTQEQLRTIPGVGKMMVQELVNLCAEHGLTVKP